MENPTVYEQSNSAGTLNLLEACRKFGIRTFIFSSSSSVYGGNKKIPFAESDSVDNPISLYAATKKYGELLGHVYHHLYGIRFTALRFFTVYGPWGRPDMAPYKFTDYIARGKTIDLYNHGKMKRDFTYITDVVQAVKSALEKEYPFEIINVGNSEPVDLMHFVGCIEKAVGKKAITNMLPMQPGDVLETYADIGLAKKKLGFSPKVSIEEGMHNFATWYQSYHA